MKRFKIDVEEVPEWVECETLNDAVRIAEEHISVHEVEKDDKTI